MTLTEFISRLAVTALIVAAPASFIASVVTRNLIFLSVYLLILAVLGVAVFLFAILTAIWDVY